ncbi:MAG: N-acetylglucosamine-6-phosphate deacetylase [Verrucomicrobiales bacterium]|nr:N-acetylglucosamine-6-phosphate deacetylase [Verrucomicrobiales bacterium]
MNPSAPRLFDPQVNGYAGVDFQKDHVSLAELEHAAAGWRRDGGESFYLTLITDAWPKLVGRLRHLRDLLDPASSLRKVVVGWHIEGPFLSEKPGFHGAHDPACMADPTVAHIRELREAAGDAPVLLTLAPERPGSIAAIETACSLGMSVSLGHTDASADQIRDAMSAGATGFTHLANGCPQQLDRHDNILWRVLESTSLHIGLIADGIHVSPALFRLIHRWVPSTRLYYTTDAMAAAGAPPGDYTIGRLQVRVGEDGIVRQPGRQNFAGSALAPGRLIDTATAMLGSGGRSEVFKVVGEAARWLEKSELNSGKA